MLSRSFSAYSTPTFIVSDETLEAQANRWFPEPNVTWFDHVQKVLEANTNLQQNPAGIFSVVSTLRPINRSEVYTLHIANELVTAVSQVTVNGTYGFKSAK